MAFADLQRLFLSGEQIVAHGPLVSVSIKFTVFDLSIQTP